MSLLKPCLQRSTCSVRSRSRLVVLITALSTTLLLAGAPAASAFLPGQLDKNGPFSHRNVQHTTTSLWQQIGKDFQFVTHRFGKHWKTPGHIALIALAIVAGIVLLALRMAFIALAVVVAIGLLGSLGIAFPHLPF